MSIQNKGKGSLLHIAVKLSANKHANRQYAHKLSVLRRERSAEV